MATGAINMAIFGAVWTAAGSGGLAGASGVILLVVGWSIAAVLGVGALWLRRGARAFPDDVSPQAQADQRNRLRIFNSVFVLEFAAIAIAVFALLQFGMGSLIPSVVTLIVGIHFFPLARLFKVRAYHLTGALLCTLALTSLLLAPGARLAVVGMGSATTLFATAAYLLYFGSATIHSRTLGA